MNILVGFVNSYQTPGSVPLGILNAKTMEFKEVDLPREVPRTGIQGIAMSESLLYIGLQNAYSGDIGSVFNEKEINTTPPALLIFDRCSFTLLNCYVFNLVRDVHSFLLSDNGSVLYVVSTGTDEVVELRLNNSDVMSEHVFWRPNPGGERRDNYHLNGICDWNGDICVSGFGLKADGKSWSSALNGFIYNITKSEQLISGLEHPHSITCIDSQIVFCESAKKRIRILNTDIEVELPGYARGLCMVDGDLFVGTSTIRSKSKSTGLLVNNSRFKDAGCSITKISCEDYKVKDSVSLNGFAKEIYELLSVQTITSWPIKEPVSYQQDFHRLWISKVNTVLQNVKEIVPSGETLILVDDNTWENANNNLANYRRLFFLDKDGEFYGLPANDEIAIKELNRLKADQGANFIAFGWSSFWWFEYYKEFTNYLRSNFKCIEENEKLTVFDLNS